MAGLVFSLQSPGEPLSFAMSKDGGLATAVCRDYKLRVWSLPQTRLLHTIDISGRDIDVTAMSGDGRWILVGDHKGAVTIWRSSTGDVHMQLQLVHYPWPAAFSRDSRTLAIAPMGGAVQVFDIGARQKRLELEHPVGGTNALSFSRGGTRIATVDGDCAVRIYDALSGKLLARNDDSLMEPSSVDFTADGRQVVVGGVGRVTAYLDTATGKVVRRMDRDLEPPLFLQFSENAMYLAILFFKADNMLEPAPVAVWEAQSGRKSLEWLPHTLPLGAAWTENGELLVAIPAKDALQIWRVMPPG
jgi:WD40 repeat protein